MLKLKEHLSDLLVGHSSVGQNYCLIGTVRCVNRPLRECILKNEQVTLLYHSKRSPAGGLLHSSTSLLQMQKQYVSDDHALIFLTDILAATYLKRKSNSDMASSWDLILTW